MSGTDAFALSDGALATGQEPEAFSQASGGWLWRLSG
jgi:hypothetical protein